MSVTTSVTVRPVTSKKDLEAFIRMPWVVYRGETPDPAWVPPLLQERREFLDRRKNPFFRHGEAELFVAFRDGKPVGRISAHINGEHDRVHGDGAGFFGFFEAIDDEAVAKALLERAEAWLRARGRASMRGPFSFTINDECGVLVEGHDIAPYPMMSHSPPYYARLLEAQGLTKAKDLFSWGYKTGELPKPIRQMADAAKKSPGVTVRTIDMKALERDVRIIMDIFNEAWAKNWGFVPLTDAEITKLAADLKLFVVPDLCLIAEIDGEPAAISFALPNIHEHIADLDGKLLPFGFAKLFWRVKRVPYKSARLVALGIRPKFRGTGIGGKGLSVLLYAEMNDRGARLGLTHGELGWTLEDNDKINMGIKLMGGNVHRRHRIYEKALVQAQAAAAPAGGDAAARRTPEEVG